ncbi:MAG: transglutaminase domain-containing protein, partial [Candidatus Saccharibacteria bacterium]|nr:transglutaminase domain-containing protein [Pseudorhodobacter sp.]
MFLSRTLNRCVTAALTSALTFVWSGAPYAQTSAALQDQQALVFADQVKASLLALEDGDRDAPRDHWDPQYVVDQIGIEPADLYAWVQTNVAFVPYLGALRGAEGVLMDRVGNSLDQSMLLAALLTNAGYPTRLAHAKLPSATVEGLWTSLAAARTAQTAAAVVAPKNASLLDAADLYGLDRNGVGEVIDKTNADAAQVFVDLAPNVGAASAALAHILGPAGVVEPAGTIVAAAKVALSDHWWVEYQDNGTWTGLDLMAPDAASGALVAAADTFDPAALPEASEQRVTVRVIAEQLKDGTLNQKVVLEQAMKPRDLLGTTMGFRHFPMAWPQDWPQMTPDDVQIKLRAALYAQTEWLPVLTVGDTVLGSAGILDTGEIDPTPHPVNPFVQMTTAMIGMVSKATDVLATGADNDQLLAADPELDIPRPPRAEGELVSERLEFTISRPGADPIVTSRDVFDLVGPDARAKGDLSSFTMSGQKALDRSIAMLEESEIQVLASKLDPDFLIHLGAQSALQNRPVLDDLSKDPFGKLPSNYMELFSKLTGLPYALYGLASLRFSLNNYSDWVYVDRPVVVLQHTRLRRAGGGDFLAGVSLDIVENGIGVDPFAADNAFGLRLSQGVADTFAEAAALQQIGTVQPNVASVFAGSGQPGAGWIALRPGDQPLLGSVGWNADAKARMAQDLAIGNMLVLPAVPTAEQQIAGWWRIDPATGQTLGVSATGHGQAMVEYALIIIIETMMAAAQCALEASLTKALEKTLAEKAAGADSGKATGAGVKAGFEQAKKDVGNASLRNRCMALGMFAGFKSLLLGFAMHAIRTAGNKGYDGSKPADSWERNAINNARNGSNTPGRPSTPTLPGIAP